MRTIEKIILIIYSYLMLIISVVACLLLAGFIEVETITDFINVLLEGELSSKIILGASIVFILLSVKCIFFDSVSKEKSKERKGVLLENESGKLMISKETIENLVAATAKDFQSAKEIITRVELDKENNVKIFANLTVTSDVVIKELSANLQTKIKEKIKIATDLDVAEVNIIVKKVVTNVNTI